MPARRKQIVSNALYELEIRARTGLPFPCLRLIKLLLASAMARSQRDSKVTVCHYLWMGNHLHLLLIARDAEACAQFYSELMKKITDYMKRLLSLDQLELWEPSGVVLSQVLDLDAALDRVAYLYANPSRAGLVDSVSDYPGLSSFAAFRQAPDAPSHTEHIPWIRQPAIPALTSRTVEDRQDRFLSEKLKKSATIAHPLTIHPNALYAVFDVVDQEDIARCNSLILDDLAAREASNKALRQKTGRAALGARRLSSAPIMKQHTPKKVSTDRKVLFHTSRRDLALSFLEQLNHFCALCRDAYLAWRTGNYLVEWPPGAFRPPLRPSANLWCCQ